jgi:hypothetical protein
MLGRLQDVSGFGELKCCSFPGLCSGTLELCVHDAICHRDLQGKRRAPNAVLTLSRRLLAWRCGSFGRAVIPPLVAVLAKMNKRAPAAPRLSAASRSAISMFDCALVSATLNVRGLSLPDQTRAAARRRLDRLLVSLHRAVVSRLSRT